MTKADHILAGNAQTMLGALAKGETDIDSAALVAILERADEMYHNDEESFLSDSDYDALRQFGQANDPTNSYFSAVGSSVRGGKIRLPHPMGSLTQAQIGGDLERWVSQYNLQDELIVASDKMDGHSDLGIFTPSKTTAAVKIAYSRGDGIEGADVTRHFSKIHNVPKSVTRPMTVRGEVIIRPANFEKLNKMGVRTRAGLPYKNPRNMVSGLMNASENDPRVYKFIDFVAYEIVAPAFMSKSEQFSMLHSQGFQTAPFKMFRGKDLTDEKMSEYLIARRKGNNYEIDGIVLEVDDAELRKSIQPGRDTLNPEYARKYKVADGSNVAIATVDHVEINISKDGYLKPRVCIEPVELVGVTIRHATGFNMKFINDNQIGPGAKVRITRSGDVIPFIMGVVAPMPFPAGSKIANGRSYKEWFQCQLDEIGECEWTESGVDLKLVDTRTNTHVAFESLLDFFNSIGVAGLKEGNLRSLFDAGFTRPEDVINLDAYEIGSVINSAVTGKKIHDGMIAALTDIKLYELMGAHPAMGRGVGVRKMKKLYECYADHIDDYGDIAKIVAVHGFNEKTAQKIARGLPEFKAFMTAVRHKVKIAKYVAPKIGALTGKSFVFTGFRDSTLEALVERAGGKMSTSVSSKTSYLVTDDVNSPSGKAKKARDAGVPIITVAQLYKML